MRDLIVGMLVALLVFFVAASQVAAAVLPLVIILRLVPPEDRADLADLIAASRNGRGLGIRALVVAARAARALRQERGGAGRGDGGGPHGGRRGIG